MGTDECSAGSYWPIIITALHNTKPKCYAIAALSNKLTHWGSHIHKHKMVVVRFVEGDGREVQVLTSYYCLLPDGGVMIMP